MKNTLLLDALACSNTRRAPVWLMRQAGRYLPEYRALRGRYSLWDLFHCPELAVEVTLQPINLFGLDAAILFSDILVIAEAFGLQVFYPDGAAPTIELCSNFDLLEATNIEETLHYVKKTIQLLKPELKIPLIGFCGGPFTIATYMVPHLTVSSSLHPLLEKITEASILYLKMQIEAGVNAVQIFDSWADKLSPEQFQEFSLHYLQKICAALKGTGVPVILFCRGSSNYPELLSAIQPAAISFDWKKEMAELRSRVPRTIAVQGNLDPEFLKNATSSEVAVKTGELLETMRGDPGFILNLGHGVLPQTPVDNVRAFVYTALNF
jgi:uroporphyrinogen decarboxylase